MQLINFEPWQIVQHIYTKACQMIPHDSGVHWPKLLKRTLLQPFLFYNKNVNSWEEEDCLQLTFLGAVSTKEFLRDGKR